MKSFFAAVGAALRGAFSALRSIVSLPGRLLGAVFGGTAVPPPTEDSAMVQRLTAEHNSAEIDRIAENAQSIARLVVAWAMDSVIADGPVPAPVPPHVSRAVANWLPGLTRDECLKLFSADFPTISAHIDGTARIDGLRAVQRLTPEPWPLEFDMFADEAEPNFIAHALSDEPSVA